MSVKEDYLELKSKWIHSHGIEREEVQQQLDAFFATLDEKGKVIIKEATDEEFKLLHQKTAEALKDVAGKLSQAAAAFV
ncbi:MAG: hypothetical protein LUI85_01155 [Bacteroides sp.]|nr:hypothetical protein [Bacteroides sp.]